MKKKNKITLGIVGLATIVLFATGCTANFCTNKDKSKIAYALEPGVSEFIIGDVEATDDIYKIVDIGNVHQVVRVEKNEDGTVKSFKNSNTLNTILDSAKGSSVAVPSTEYFCNFDKIAFDATIAAYNAHNVDKIDVNTITDAELLKRCLEDYGYVRFFANDSKDTFGNYKELNKLIRNEGLSVGASLDFEDFYMSSMFTVVNQYRSCITFYDKVKYGNYNGSPGKEGTQIWLEKVSWKDAWGKGGHIIEGLVVYPVARLIDNFAVAFAGGKNASPDAIYAKYQTGVPQLFSIIVVTIIVRLFIFLCTFRSTMAQKKMTELQPELAKIQQKYPNANTNQAQKQRLAEEQMRLYKKHKVNPLSQLLVLIIQFPVFIGVWGAMTGSAVLSTGAVMGLHLSDSIWATLKLGPAQALGGWWTALVLIILMSAGQFFSMKVPQWIQKAKAKNVAKLGKNPAQKQQNRTANIISYAMLIMIIIMGFTLPAAMGVYWFVGAIVSLIQTVFTNILFASDRKKRKK